MEIADIYFAISCRNAVVFQESGGACQSFLKRMNREPRAIHIKIGLELANMPGTKKLTKIFDGDQTWSIFKDDEEYLLLFTPPDFEHPLWLARFKDDCAEVTIYCGRELVTEKNGQLVVSNPFLYPLDQLLLMYILAHREGAIIHSAGVNLNGCGLIFPGKSGAGKSTLARQFVAKKVEALSDDRMIVRKIDGHFHAFGTPWPGTEKIALNKSAPLAGLFFICHAPTNKIKELKPQAALEKLLPVTSIPWYDREVMPKTLDFLEDLITYIPAFELHFKPTPDVVDFLQKFVSA